jgi:ADP-ribose pyrophosphatase
MDSAPELLRSRRVYEGQVVNLDLDTIRTPSGTSLELEIVRHPGASAIVPLLGEPSDADPAVLLIEQYRWAAGGRIWEIPAGVIEAGEQPEETARRELLEETGARARHFDYLTTLLTTPGFTDERIHLFLATGITAGEPNPQGDEFMRVEAHPISRVLEMIRDGQIRDAKSIVALLYVAGYRLGL